MEDISRTEEQNKRKGLIFSVVFHTLVIILAALYGFTYQSPPPEPGGILVNLGVPDVGQGNENAPAGEPVKPVEKPEPEPVKETPPPKPEPKTEPVKEQPKPQPQKEVRTTEDPAAVALRKRQEEERKKAEAEAKAKADAAEAARKAEDARKAEEERKRKELEALVSGGLGGGSGSGKGNTGKPGNQGDPGGDPNSNVLTGISSGSGTVGGGLGNRGVARRGPAIQDNSQVQGTVVISLCVDKDGNVIGEPEFTQRGSTTSDANLRRLAIQNAKQWKFQPGTVDRQCGTIQYDFRLR